MILAILKAAKIAALTPPLILIGGGPDEPDIMTRSMLVAGGNKAKVGVISVASRNPPVSGRAYEQFLATMGYSASYIPYGPRPAAEAAAALKALETPKVLFLSGGDQRRLLNRFGNTAVPGAMSAAWRKGTVLAGTSAGAMVWGKWAIAGGNSTAALRNGFGLGPDKEPGLDLRRGLDLVPSLIADTHFGTRGRLGRLLLAVATHPGTLGIGVDERSAAVVDFLPGKGQSGAEPRIGAIRAWGRGSVTVIESEGLKTIEVRKAGPEIPVEAGPFRVHVLIHGQYRTVKPIQPYKKAADTISGFVVDDAVWEPGGAERLLRSALDSKAVGIGLTAAGNVSIAQGIATVTGDTSAIVIDPWRVGVSLLPAGTPAAAQDIEISLVAPGGRYDLENHRPLKR